MARAPMRLSVAQAHGGGGSCLRQAGVGEIAVTSTSLPSGRSASVSIRGLGDFADGGPWRVERFFGMPERRAEGVDGFQPRGLRDLDVGLHGTPWRMRFAAHGKLSVSGCPGGIPRVCGENAALP